MKKLLLRKGTVTLSSSSHSIESPPLRKPTPALPASALPIENPLPNNTHPARPASVHPTKSQMLRKTTAALSAYPAKKLLLLPATFLFASFSFAQKTNYHAAVDAAADKLEPQTIAWRRDFHEHPELGNHETRTAKIIADHLRSLGLDVKEGVGKTGVVGILKGRQPGPVIGLRADMDGLPIVERTPVPFASKVKSTYNGQEVGVMHACGHDAHVAILLSTATVLAGMKKDLKGTVKFVFQPAEEGPPAREEGGADLMIKEGVLDDPKVDEYLRSFSSSVG